MQGPSRLALAKAQESLDSYVDGGAAGEDLARLGDDLFRIVGVLDGEPALRRHLADAALPDEARTGLVERLFRGKVSERAEQTLREVAAARWSGPRDLVDGIEALARQATLAEAERAGRLEDVEDELFRFGRILDREPRLRSLLADPGAPADRRVELLEELLADKVAPVTDRLLRHAVRAPRGGSLDVVAEQLAELAAGRRDRSIARVTAPVALTDEQQERLAGALSRIYGRPISIQVDLDPDVLGGLVVRMGDEVIDGSIAARLRTARQQLPR